jgi:hypothetical protein
LSGFHLAWRLVLVLVLLLGLHPFSAWAATRAEPIEVQVVVRSSGSGPDEVSFVYATAAKGQKVRATLEARARQDFRQLATAMGQPGAAVSVSTRAVADQIPPTTSAQGKLLYLVNRPAGWLNIGPFLKLFARYERLNLVYFVESPFQFRGPRGPFDDPTMAMTLQEGGMAFTYDIRLKHSPGQGMAELPSFEAPGGLAALGKAGYWLVVVMALVVGALVYALVQFWGQRRREAL